jgi:hypothetical protein
MRKQPNYVIMILVGFIMLLGILSACQSQTEATYEITTTLVTTLGSESTKKPQPTPTPTQHVLDPATATPDTFPDNDPRIPDLKPTKPSFDLQSTDPSHYELRPPDQTTILYLIFELNRQLDQLDFDDYETYSSHEGISSFTEVVDFEIRRLYPQGLPTPQSILNLPSLRSERSMFPLVLPSVFPSLIGDAIADYFSQKQIALVDGESINGPNFQAMPHLVELDHDSGSEWLLRVHSKEFDSLFWFTLNESSGPSYELMETELTQVAGGLFFDTYELTLLGDFTGDGLTDAIVEFSYFMLERVHLHFNILQGSPEGFHTLSTISEFVNTQVGETINIETPTTILPTEPALNITKITDLNWDCRWETITSYSWPNGVERISIQNEDPPNTPKCLVAQVFEDFSFDAQVHVRMLESALQGFSDAEPEEKEIAQFARYRLALLYVLLGQQKAAKELLQDFVDQYSTGTYQGSELADHLQTNLLPLLDAPGIHPLALCELTYNQPELFVGWSPFINMTAISPGNTFSTELFPYAICPMDQLLTQQMNRLTFNPTQSPESIFSANGIPISISLSLPLKGKSTPAWFVLTETNPSMLFAYAPENGDFAWQKIYTFMETSYEPTWLASDQTGDGYPEIAFMIPSSQSWDCTSGENAYDVHLTTRIGNGIYLSTWKTFCWPETESFDLSSALEDKDGDGLIDWVMDEITSSYDLSPLYDHVPLIPWLTQSSLSDIAQPMQEPAPQEQDWDDRVFAGQDLALVRQGIQIELEQLSQDDPLGHYTQQHFTYLIALSYELEGQDDKAIRLYLDLALDKTETLWGVLAASRLQWLGGS